MSSETETKKEDKQQTTTKSSSNEAHSLDQASRQPLFGFYLKVVPLKISVFG